MNDDYHGYNSVIPAQTGIQENEELNRLDPGVHRGDDVWGVRRDDGMPEACDE
ncbi:MAG: hypothetical protein Q7R41_01055 [Phycisphaerales bacterium]|nr:hypothetical protein [Phycisphaerales bacterium]